MKNFDIVKYLREHQLGSYGILNHYVDLKPLKEEETAVAFNSGEKVKFNSDFAGDLKQASIDAGVQPEVGHALAEFPNDVFDVIKSGEKQTVIKFEGDEIVVPTKILVKATEINEEVEQDQDYIDDAIFALIGYNAPNSKDIEKKIKANLKNLSSNQIELLKTYGEKVVQYNQAANDPQGAIGTEYGLPNPELDKGIIDILTKDLREDDQGSMGANRIMDIGGNSMEKAIFRLKDSGFDAEDVINLFGKLMYQYFGKEDVDKLMSHFGKEDEYDMEDEEDLF